MENNRKKSAGIPKILTMEVKNKVKKVKLATKPIITPTGRVQFPTCPPIMEVNIIGSMGKIQGERIVTTPAKKANATRIIIEQFYQEACQVPHRSRTESPLHFCLSQQKYVDT